MLLWTVVFAASTVLLSFALGLLLAVTLQKKIFGQRVYRSLLVIPYAVPSFLTILVWAGLLNQDYGIVNKMLHLEHRLAVRSLVGAQFAVILVSVWLTFPYFFLVCLGALQSIPGDLVEAARVDGAGGLAGLPPDHAAAAARRDRAADDRLVRVQLQQLQQHLPADRRGPIDR